MSMTRKELKIKVMIESLEKLVGKKIKLIESPKNDVITYTLPTCFASYLMNDDSSGLEDSDIEQIDKFVQERKIYCVGVLDNEKFTSHNDLDNFGADCSTFQFRKLSPQNSNKLEEDIIPTESTSTPVVQKPMQKSQVDMSGAIPIERLKKGAIFQFPGKEREYYFDGFNRSTGKYSFYRADDINAFGEKKKGTLVIP